MEHAISGDRVAVTQSKPIARGAWVKLLISWAVVLVPLAWGVYEALQDVILLM